MVLFVIIRETLSSTLVFRWVFLILFMWSSWHYLVARDYLKKEWEVQIHYSYREANFCAVELNPLLLVDAIGTLSEALAFFVFLFGNQKKWINIRLGPNCERHC